MILVIFVVLVLLWGLVAYFLPEEEGMKMLLFGFIGLAGGMLLPQAGK